MYFLYSKQGSSLLFVVYSCIGIFKMSDLELTEDDISISNQLHDATIKKNHVLVVSQIKGELSENGFLFLFHNDLEFGSFGMPIAQQDQDLNIIALTSFQPYDRIVVENEGDVITLLTPIYRILKVNAIIVAKMAEFEDFSKLGSINSILPTKPKTGVSVQRYSTLLEVAESVWTSVCHVYCRPSEPDVIQELHCFETNRTKGNYVWIDVNTKLVRKINFNNNVESQPQWAKIVYTTYPSRSEIDVALAETESRTGDMMVYTFITTLKTMQDNDHIFVTTSGSGGGGALRKSPQKRKPVFYFQEPTAEYYYRTSNPGETRIVRWINIDSKKESWIAKEKERTQKNVPCLTFSKEPEGKSSSSSSKNGDDDDGNDDDDDKTFPLCLQKISSNDTLFVLITVNGGHYSAFYRSTPDGRVIPYPLYKHWVPETPEERRQREHRCRWCQKENGTLNDFDMNRRPDGSLYWYCSTQCIQKTDFLSPRRRSGMGNSAAENFQASSSSTSKRTDFPIMEETNNKNYHGN